MATFEIQAKSLIRVQKRVDSWFLSRFGMNAYRGCGHACSFCDGRAERYYVDGDFGRDVGVKVNAAELLDRELDPTRRRKPLRPGYAVIGGGIGDAWQPADGDRRLARGLLEVLVRRRWPVHVLTRSPRVEQELDLLGQADRQRRAILSMSFSCVDDELSKVLEPGAPPPSARLALLADAKRRGLSTGAYLLPVIPHLTDGDDQLEAAAQAFAEAGLDFVMVGGLTLRQGRQRDHFLGTIAGRFPDASERLARMFAGPHPHPPGPHRDLESRWDRLARAHGLPPRMPPRLWVDLLDGDEGVLVAMEHLEHLARLDGEHLPLRAAADHLARQSVPLWIARGDLNDQGIAPAALELIGDLLDQGPAACLAPYQSNYGETP